MACSLDADIPRPSFLFIRVHRRSSVVPILLCLLVVHGPWVDVPTGTYEDFIIYLVQERTVIGYTHLITPLARVIASGMAHHITQRGNRRIQPFSVKRIMVRICHY